MPKRRDLSERVTGRIAERFDALAAKHARESLTRYKAGKKPPLARPLRIGSKGEVERAMKRGKIPFYHKGKKIEIPLRGDWGLFQGVYALADGSLFVVRCLEQDPQGDTHLLRIREDNGEEIQSGNCAIDNFSTLHLRIFDKRDEDKVDWKRQGLATILFAKAIKHAVTTGWVPTVKGRITISWGTPEFVPVVKKLGFEVRRVDVPEGSGFEDHVATRSAEGLAAPENNMNEFYSFEAINENGEIETVSFRTKWR